MEFVFDRKMIRFVKRILGFLTFDFVVKINIKD